MVPSGRGSVRRVMNLRPGIWALSGIVIAAATLGCEGRNPSAVSRPAPETAAPKAATTATTTASAMTSASAKPMAAPEEKEAALKFRIPLDGAKVFQAFDVRITLPDGLDLKAAAKGGQDGKVVVLPLEKALEAGAEVPEGVTPVEIPREGEPVARVTLDEPGEQKLTVQILDGEGKGFRPELANTVTVTVVETPPKLEVAWLEPKDGATVKSPVKMKFGVTGMEIVEAGKDLKNRTVGHHHVLINEDSYPMGEVIPADDTHKHFGKGQTEAELELPKGKHTLALQFADGTHTSYGKPMAATITVTVE